LILPGNLNKEKEMKNKTMYLIFVVSILVSLAACAAPPTPTVPPATPTTQPLAPPTQPPTEIPPTSIPIPPEALAISVGDRFPPDVTLDQIILINKDGFKKEITDATKSTYFEHPSWSPDGSKIAFSSGHGDCPYSIWVMNADGSEKKKITNERFCDFFPSWSPDGTQIAFTRYKTGSCQLYVVKPDGSGLKNLNKWTTDVFPIWSPDGRIFFIHRQGNCEDTTGDVFAINSDGTELTQITNFGYVGGVGISPDGKTIAYHDTKKNQIMIYPLDGSLPPNPIFTVDFCADYIQPAWSPDGKTIAVAAANWTILCGSKLYLVNVDGSGSVEIPFDKAIWDPTWKPK
jgi:Tol biopolymer transport system component